jgi:hypothetical protein
VAAEVPYFPEPGERLCWHEKPCYLDRLSAYLEAEVDLGLLDIADVIPAARQFLGMLDGLVSWPRMAAPDAALS